MKVTTALAILGSLGTAAGRKCQLPFASAVLLVLTCMAFRKHPAPGGRDHCCCLLDSADHCHFLRFHRHELPCLRNPHHDLPCASSHYDDSRLESFGDRCFYAYCFFFRSWKC